MRPSYRVPFVRAIRFALYVLTLSGCVACGGPETIAATSTGSGGASTSSAGPCTSDQTCTGDAGCAGVIECNEGDLSPCTCGGFACDAPAECVITGVCDVAQRACVDGKQGPCVCVDGGA